MKKLILLIAFVITGLMCFAQQSKIDSLKKVITFSKMDTVVINTLIELSWEYCYGALYDSSVIYCNKVLKEAAVKSDWNSKKIAEAYLIIGTTNLMKGNYNKSLSGFYKAIEIDNKIDYKEGVARAYMNIGSVYLYKSEYDSAVFFYNKSLAIKQLLKNDYGISDVYICLGAVYFNQGNYPTALNSFYTALKIKEKINDDNGISSCLNNIATISISQNNYDKALEMYISSLRISERLNDKQGMVNSYSNIGDVYRKKGNFEKALESHINALKLYEEMEFMLGYSTALLNIGLDYDNLNKKTEALEYYLKAVKVKKEIEDQAGLAQCYVNLGKVYTKFKKFSEAKKYLDEALSLSTEIGSKTDIKNSYGNLSILDSTQGNWRAAYEHHKLFILYCDSIDNEETKEKIIQSSMNYEFEKKEALTKAEQDKKDALAATEMKKQQIIRYAVSGILVLVILFTLFLYNRFRLIRKQKNIIELKEKETLQQKHVIEEKHREITDSINYAERIQRSFLATTEMLDKNLNSSLRGSKQSQAMQEIASLPSDARNDDSNYFVFFKPKDIVSGDFYWAGELNNGQFALSCADSTGHGVPGAIMSILNISSLEKSIEQENEPHKILNTTRKIIIERLKKDGSAEGGKDGMDCSLLVINKEKTQLSFAAANNPVFIVRSLSPFEGGARRVGDVELIEFKADKMPVGKHDKDTESFTLQTVSLQKGDIIYTLTDGFPDQFGGEKGKKYMIKNLKALLLQIAPLSMQEQEQKLADEFTAWKGDSEQVDDVCIIGVKI